MGIDAEKLGSVLNDINASLSKRFRALFMLRSLKSDDAVAEISRCLVDKSDLLNHELAYCLGQMQNETAIPKLIEILENESLAIILRHEAAEALGAIGRPATLTILEKYSCDSCQEVAETCQLAISRIGLLLKENFAKENLIPSPFSSVDPAPSGSCTCSDISYLEGVLLDPKIPLFDRYRAMFSLRNINNDEAAISLTKGLFCEESALFRHEIAYVLGQMQLDVAVPALIKSLSNTSENSMVRHESAEALGSIATERCYNILQKYLIDSNDIVRESCEVALDMYKQETEEFTPGNTLA